MFLPSRLSSQLKLPSLLFSRSWAPKAPFKTMSDSLLVLRDLGIKHRHKHNTELTGLKKYYEDCINICYVNRRQTSNYWSRKLIRRLSATWKKGIFDYEIPISDVFLCFNGLNKNSDFKVIPWSAYMFLVEIILKLQLINQQTEHNTHHTPVLSPTLTVSLTWIPSCNISIQKWLPATLTF